MMKQSKANIERQIIDFLNNLGNVKFAYLFGSFVESENYRDIDIAVYFSDDNYDTLNLAVKLENLLGVEIDLIDLKKAGDIIGFSAIHGKLIVNNDDDFRVDFIVALLARYFDIQYYRQRFLEELDYDED